MAAYKKQPKKQPVAEDTIREGGIIIRKGNRHPHRIAPPEQVRARVEVLANWLATHPAASETRIWKAFGPKWGIQWRRMHVYTKMAYERLRRDTNIPISEARRRGLSLVTKLMESKNPNIALKAEKAHREIHGYDAPKQMQVSGPDGKPMMPGVVVVPTVKFVLPEKKTDE